jgi:hypothetical protein
MGACAEVIAESVRREIAARDDGRERIGTSWLCGCQRNAEFMLAEY